MARSIKRRTFLQRAASGLLAAGVHATQAAKDSPHAAPFRTIYSNDTTHILSCKMPWRERTDPLTDVHIAKSITEAAGVDAHFLQPGLGWIPWWKSEIYSPHEHYAEFLQKQHGHKSIHKIARYLLDGGDMLETLIKTCGEVGVAPFLSFRLNDGHHVRNLREALKTGTPSHDMSRHYWENYQRFRIGDSATDWDQGVFDWSIPEVRDHKFALIEEVFANYDLAGLELDFLRHWIRFGEATPVEQRREITTDFVRRIREMLDRTAASRGLPRRWLCVRVPARADVRPDQGIDLAALGEAGTDMVNLSYSYFTVQDDSMRTAIREIDNHRIAVYAEMTHCTMTGKATNGSGTQPFLRTTDEQFYTTAQLNYGQGARGVSLFNFPYYRYHVPDDIGPFHEPPFHVLPKLKNRDFLAQQKPWYFLTACRRDRVLGEKPLPALIEDRDPHVFVLHSTGAVTAAESPGLLRLRSEENIADRELQVNLDGQVLNETAFVAQPIPHPYDVWTGEAEQFRCYEVPVSVLQKCAAQIDIGVTLTGGIRLKLQAMDLVLVPGTGTGSVG